MKYMNNLKKWKLFSHMISMYQKYCFLYSLYTYIIIVKILKYFKSLFLYKDKELHIILVVVESS